MNKSPFPISPPSSGSSEHPLDNPEIRHQELALLFLDLDDFKVINDEHGHKSGDDCLRRISNNLLKTVRPSDIVGRLGGDAL